MKHTPGPWEIDGHNLTAVIHNEGSVTWPQWKHVCSCDYGYADPEKHFEENKANAHLIAAAPEMLEVLEDIIRIVKPGDKTGWYNTQWIKAEQAIKKAKGI